MRGVSMDKFRLLLRPAGKRRLTGRKAMAVAIISVLFAIYQLTEPIWGINVMLPYMHRVIHLSVALLIVFLLYSPLEHKKEDGKESISVFDLLFGISAIGAGIYVMLNIDRFEVHLLRIDPFTIGDKIVGLLFLVLVFEAVRRVTGFILNFVILAVVAFTLLGHKIPGLFGHSYIPFWQFVEGELLTMDGLFGTALGVAANYIFLFVLFGVFLDRAGVGKVLFALASKATKRTKGGPAKVSIISSAMFGSISGAPVANVMTTGSITIPLMKRAGFSPTFAAAVESAASTGGTFTPPIMGSVAFLMAELTGISYLKIMVAAIIPCLLYYFTLYLMVHFYAVRYDVVPVEEEGVSDAASWGVRDWVVGISTAAVPLGAVVFVLVKGYTPIYAALVGIVLAIITSWLNKAKENRLNIRNIGFVLNYGTGVAVGISMICAAAGIVIGGLVQSGLTGKIASLVLGWSGGSLFMGLVFTAVLCVILGMGMPIPAAYLITASLSIPCLLYTSDAADDLLCVD